MAASVLIADTRNSTLSALQLLLDQQDDLHVIGKATKADQILTFIAPESPQLLLIESGILQNESAGWVEMYLNRSPGLAIIVMCSTPIALCWKQNRSVAGYVSKSDPPETLLATVRKAIERPKSREVFR